MKCFERVTLEQRENVFEGFWELGDRTAQNALLCGSVKVTSVKKRSAKKGEMSLHSRRNYSRQYYINDNRTPTRICKKAFLAIYAISNGRLSRAVTDLCPLLLYYLFSLNLKVNTIISVKITYIML